MHLLLSKYEGRLCVRARPPTTGFFPLKKKKTRKENNTVLERFGSYVAGFLQRVGTVWATALGLGRGRGLAKGWKRGQVG